MKSLDLENALFCADLIATLEEKKIHNFIRHYEDRQVKLFELPPMDTEEYAIIAKHATSTCKQKDEYDFYDSVL